MGVIMALHICASCNIEFKVRGNRSRKYCSRKCYGDVRRSSKEHFYFSKLISKRQRHLTISVEDCLDLWDKQRGLCAITGIPMTVIRGEGRVTTNASLDRIQEGGSYSKGNIRLTCVMVNLMRLDNTDNDFLWWCKKIIDGINS